MVVTVAVFSLLPALSLAQEPPTTPPGDPALSSPSAIIEVWKTRSCGCCRPWIRYMESQGFRLQVNDVDDLDALNASRAVPGHLHACHTAFVDGYYLGGHVSGDDVRRLLIEKPVLKGIVVLGMPKGAPGMEGPDPEPYDVLAVHPDGHTTVFSQHPAEERVHSTLSPAPNESTEGVAP